MKGARAIGSSVAPRHHRFKKRTAHAASDDARNRARPRFSPHVLRFSSRTCGRASVALRRPVGERHTRHRAPPKVCTALRAAFAGAADPPAARTWISGGCGGAFFSRGGSVTGAPGAFAAGDFGGEGVEL